MTSIVCASAGTSLHNLPIPQAGTCYSETEAGETHKKGAPLVNKAREEEKRKRKKGSTQQKSLPD